MCSFREEGESDIYLYVGNWLYEYNGTKSGPSLSWNGGNLKYQKRQFRKTPDVV